MALNRAREHRPRCVPVDCPFVKPLEGPKRAHAVLRTHRRNQVDRHVFIRTTDRRPHELLHTLNLYACAAGLYDGRCGEPTAYPKSGDRNQGTGAPASSSS